MTTVRLAATPAEIEAALRLRYQVFYVEGGDGRYADHQRQLWTDCDDGPQSHLIVALDESNRVIGTTRVTVLRDWKFIGHQSFHLDNLAAHLGADGTDLSPRVVRMDRGAIAVENRGQGHTAKIQFLAERTAIEHRCDLMVGAIRHDNVRSRRDYEKLGWKEYPAVGTHGGFWAQLFYKLLSPPPGQ